MIGLEEAAELARLAGEPLAKSMDGYSGPHAASEIMVSVADLERIRELASLVQSDAQEEADHERLNVRAADYVGLLDYVQSIKDENHPDDFWDILERVLDDLDRGMSDTLEEFAEWRKAERWKVIEEQKFLVDLWSAADLWREHRAELMAKGVGRGECLRIEQEAKRLTPALDWAWGKLK